MIVVVEAYERLVRLYDGVEDNPNELTVGRAPDGRVVLLMVDRDGGNTELSLTVSEDDLLAAIAVTRAGHGVEPK
jgi:hypothetical protein